MRVVATLIRLPPPAEDFGAEVLGPPGEASGEPPALREARGGREVEA
jgi:hypothetical protein